MAVVGVAVGVGVVVAVVVGVAVGVVVVVLVVARFRVVVGALAVFAYAGQSINLE